MKFTTNFVLRASFALAVFSLGSCNRQRDLLQEQARIDAELHRVQAEHATYEARFHSLGAHVFSARETVAARLDTATLIADRLDAEVKRLETKVGAYDAFVQEHQSEVESYKSRFVR